MSDQVFPTKGNLLKIKKSLELAKVGFELLDRKRNILIREALSLTDKAKNIETLIKENYKIAYKMLERANIELGIVDELSNSVPIENGITISAKSVMGIELPTVNLKKEKRVNHFGFHRSSIHLDEAYSNFQNVKELTAQLAETESSIVRLASGIRKTQKRANALKNIVIPRFESQVKFITSALDEKEREEFSRLKVIKKNIDG